MRSGRQVPITDPVYPCWRRRHHKTVRVLDTPAEVAQAHLEADIEQQRELARLALEVLTEEADRDSDLRAR